MAQMSSLMGSVMPYITAATQVASTVDSINKIVNPEQKQQRKELRARQELALEQLRKQQELAYEQAQKKAKQQKNEINLTATLQEKERKSALKRAISRQRAKFGATGISANSGSGEAVLLGLFQESDNEKNKRESLDKLRFGAINQNLQNRKSLNLLQATQLKQKQDLENIYMN